MIYSSGKQIDKKVRAINNNFIDFSNIDEILASQKLDSLYTISEGDEMADEMTGADLRDLEKLEDQVIRLQSFDFY